MKKLAALSAFFALFTVNANANTMLDDCKARMEADGRDPAGCDCLIAEVESDPDLIDEFMSLGDIDDPAARYEAASDAAKAAMDACTR